MVQATILYHCSIMDCAVSLSGQPRRSTVVISVPPVRISLGTASTVARRHLGAIRSSFESSHLIRIVVGWRRHSTRGHCSNIARSWPGQHPSLDFLDERPSSSRCHPFEFRFVPYRQSPISWSLVKHERTLQQYTNRPSDAFVSKVGHRLYRILLARDVFTGPRSSGCCVYFSHPPPQKFQNQCCLAPLQQEKTLKHMLTRDTPVSMLAF